MEPRRLDSLPGHKRVFLSWQQLHECLAETLRGVRRVAMQYSPGNAIPYVSRVDAGTIELIRQLTVEVVSSADLVQRFEAVWTPTQWQSHLRAAKGVRETVDEAFAYIRTGHSIGEEVHGNGANMDGLETRDERRVLPSTCFSIEPGIYLAGEFGVRSEVNVYITESDVIVTGEPMQTEVIPILP